ncbi:hypothetical protein THIOM_001959 [Candidatus Thiomargarita nelsonii]|uniref:Uncharacterized protein n=1 Tax=Candidatus Thiomargarita nelsonii TaxID=1003181 RepID=A0A0A6P109_9GAMM|nr:hypothetical protein THIOM_001959 [Candidatus Thiomargarita nelsonii]
MSININIFVDYIHNFYENAVYWTQTRQQLSVIINIVILFDLWMPRPQRFPKPLRSDLQRMMDTYRIFEVLRIPKNPISSINVF